MLPFGSDNLNYLLQKKVELSAGFITFHSNSFILSPLSNSVQSFPLALSFHLSILHPEALVWNLLKQESPAEPSLHISMPEPTFPDWKETPI